MGRDPFRVEPKLPAGAMQTYAIHAPRATHWRAASCAEVGCAGYLNGWRTVLHPVDQAAQVAYIRGDRTRRHEEVPGLVDGMVVFTFEAGQRCFSHTSHRVRLDRQELYVVRGGDWRGNPDGMLRRHVRPCDWVDDFANHQARITDKIGRG